MPSASSGISNAMRDWPVSMSESTHESSSPSITIAIALNTEPLASTTANTRPSTISEKYSAGPNLSASAVSGTPSAATSTVEKQPAMKERAAAILRAVIDAGEHDQRAERRQAEGDRQQHRNGRERADAGQHADQRADQRADQAQQQVHRRDGDGKSEGEM